MHKTHSTLNTRSTTINTITKKGLQKTLYEIDAYLALDKSSISNGFTPFHEAAKIGDLKIFEYLISAFKKRSHVLT